MSLSETENTQYSKDDRTSTNDESLNGKHENQKVLRTAKLSKRLVNVKG